MYLVSYDDNAYNHEDDNHHREKCVSSIKFVNMPLYLDVVNGESLYYCPMADVFVRDGSRAEMPEVFL